MAIRPPHEGADEKVYVRLSDVNPGIRLDYAGRLARLEGRPLLMTDYAAAALNPVQNPGLWVDAALARRRCDRGLVR